jgi:signal peptidase I
MRATSQGRRRTPGRVRRLHSVRSGFGVLLLLCAVSALALCGYQTATGRWHATPVLSGSMRPGLQPGDVVVTQRVPVTDLRVRDVIVFHPPNEASRLTVHRIVKLRVKDGKTVITTRGDANTIDDPSVTSLRGATAYRVARVVPLAGYPAVWLAGGHRGLLVIGLGVLLLVGAAVSLLRPDAPRPDPRHDERGDAGDEGGQALPSLPHLADRSTARERSLLEVGTAPPAVHSEIGREEHRTLEHAP